MSQKDKGKEIPVQQDFFAHYFLNFLLFFYYIFLFEIPLSRLEKRGFCFPPKPTNNNKEPSGGTAIIRPRRKKKEARAENNASSIKW